MSTSTNRGSMDPLHIGETLREVWEKPIPNALLWPVSLIWKNIRPKFWETLETGKDAAVGAIQGTTKAAMNALFHAPFLPMPKGSR